MVTKHTGMYPRRQRTDSKSDTSALGINQHDSVDKPHNQSMVSQTPLLDAEGKLICECDTRQKDEI